MSYNYPSSAPAWPTGVFSDGSDGAADLDSVNAVAWASKAGSIYTMTRDALLTNLTIRTGSTLVKLYVPFVNGTLTIEAGGILRDNGNAAVGITGGATLSTTRRPVSAGQNGVNGRNTTGAGGNVGVNQVTSFGGSGGIGGASGLGQAGGNPGGVTAPGAIVGSARTLAYALATQLYSNTTLVNANGGSGGGAGGCNVGTGTAISGGSGGGAPASLLFAKTISNAGEIRCDGGAGGNASFTGNGQAGGGAGGGGGLLVIVTNTAAIGGTATADGGAGGTGANGGANGADGADGAMVVLAP